MGSVISHKLGPRGAIPPYVCLPNMHNSAGSAYLGPKAAPFTIEADPSSPSFAVPDLNPPLSIESERIDDRRNLLKHVDRFHRKMEAQANQVTRELGVFAKRATEEEKIKLWPTICGVYPDYQAYQERTQRNIPVFICTPLEDDE